MKLPVLSKKILIGISLSGVALLSFLVTLLLLLSKEPSQPQKPGSPVYETSEVDPSQFLLPRYIGLSERKKYYFLRPREKKWNDKEVNRYWNPIREAIGNSLKNKINEEINKIFSGVRD